MNNIVNRMYNTHHCTSPYRLIFRPTSHSFCFIASGPSVVSLFSFDFSSQLKFAAKYSNALREFSWNPFAAPPRLDMEMSRTSCGYTVSCILIIIRSAFVLVLSFYSADTSYRSCRRLHSRLAHHFSFMANATSRPSHRLFVCFACFIIFLSYNRSQMNTSVYYHINGRSMFNAECSMRITYPSILPFIFHILLL